MRTASRARHLIQYGLVLHVCLPGRGQPGPIHVHVSFILTLGATGAIGRRARTLRGRSSHAHISGTPRSVPVRLSADKTVHDALTETTECRVCGPPAAPRT